MKFIVHQLKYPSAGVRVLLDHLDDAADLGFQRATGDGARIKTQHARAHVVDQLARWVVQGAEKFGLKQRHAHDRQLQAGEPDPDRWRYAFLGQNALEHQRDDFYRRLLAVVARLVLQRCRALAQSVRHLGDARGIGHRLGRAAGLHIEGGTLGHHGDRRLIDGPHQSLGGRAPGAARVGVA